MISLNEFCANENTVSSIREAIRSKHLLSSYIIAGESGTGKLTLANSIAKAFLCASSGENNLPCGRCDACRKIDGGNHPDIIYVRPEDNKKQISVAQIRTLCSDAFVVPNESAYKVYIIENGEAMSALSQNALLKIFEQPPSHAVIIILTSDLNILLPTIISRAVVYRLNVPEYEQSFGFIKKHYAFGDNEIKNALQISHNNIGKALKILSDDEKSEDYSAFAENYLINILKNESSGLLFLKNHIKNLDMFNLFVNELKNTVKNIILFLSDDNYSAGGDFDKFSGLNEQKLFLIVELADKFIYNNSIYVNFNLCINYFNLKMREVLI